MGIDGISFLTIRGPQRTLEKIEENKLLLSKREVNFNSNLIYLMKHYFGENCTVLREDENIEENINIFSGLKIKYNFRNIQPIDFFNAILNKYPDCWLKNEYYNEDGKAGIWIGMKGPNGIISNEDTWEDFDPYEYAYDYIN